MLQRAGYQTTASHHGRNGHEGRTKNSTLCPWWTLCEAIPITHTARPGACGLRI